MPLDTSNRGSGDPLPDFKGLCIMPDSVLEVTEKSTPYASSSAIYLSSLLRHASLDIFKRKHNYAEAQIRFAAAIELPRTYNEHFPNRIVAAGIECQLFEKSFEEAGKWDLVLIKTHKAIGVDLENKEYYFPWTINHLIENNKEFDVVHVSEDREETISFSLSTADLKESARRNALVLRPFNRSPTPI